MRRWQINAAFVLLAALGLFVRIRLRFTVIAEEKLTAFLELERVTRESGPVAELRPLGGIMMSVESTALTKKVIR